MIFSILHPTLTHPRMRISAHSQVCELIHFKLMMLLFHQQRLEEAVAQNDSHLTYFATPPGETCCWLRCCQHPAHVCGCILLTILQGLHHMGWLASSTESCPTCTSCMEVLAPQLLYFSHQLTYSHGKLVFELDALQPQLYQLSCIEPLQILL